MIIYLLYEINCIDSLIFIVFFFFIAYPTVLYIDFYNSLQSVKFSITSVMILFFQYQQM